MKHPRSREVVKLAAMEVKDPFVKGALTEDTRGVFETTASALLNNENARALMVEKGMTEDDLVKEAAIVLASNAVQAEVISHRKRVK